MSTAKPFAMPASCAAPHPFRARLPRRVLSPLPKFEPEVQARIEAAAAKAADPAPAGPRPRITARGVRDFLLAYVACFVAVSAFIS